jgi:hypothetical protein
MALLNIFPSFRIVGKPHPSKNDLIYRNKDFAAAWT